MELATHTRDQEASIVDAFRGAQVTIDAEGRILALNGRAQHVFGLGTAEVSGRDFAETFVAAEYRAQLTEAFRTHPAGSSAPLVGAWQDDPRALRHGGKFEVETLIVPTPGDRGSAFSALFYDATEGGRHEDAAGLFAAFVESSDDAIFGYALDGTITSWNASAERMYGYTEAEVIGKPISIFEPGDRPGEDDGIRARIASGERIVNHETQTVARGGRLIDVSITVSPVRDRGGEIVGVSLVACDISERKRNERYRTSQYRATRLLAEPGEPAAKIHHLLAILGEGSGWQCGVVWFHTVEEGRLQCLDVWHRSDLRASMSPFDVGDEVEMAAGIPDRVEWVALGADGASLPASDRVAEAGIRRALWVPVVLDGRLYGAVELMTALEVERDEEMIASTTTVASLLTELMKRSFAETDADRLKDEFFGMVSHELRTPLTSIIGYAEMLAEYEAEGLSEAGAGFVDVILRNARREMRLVADLLALIKIESGVFDVEPEEIALASVAREAIAAALPRADDQGVVLNSELEELAPCAGDPHRLGQVLDNLLSNAIKFTPKGGRVDLRLRRSGDNALIEVADTGIGIAADEQSRLFDRLYRASTATDRQLPGLGLGLTIVKAIVEAHGGEISVASTEGEGTTFRVELPLAPLPSAVPEPVAA